LPSLLVCTTRSHRYSSQSAIPHQENSDGARQFQRLSFSGKRSPSQSVLTAAATTHRRMGKSLFLRLTFFLVKRIFHLHFPFNIYSFGERRNAMQTKTKAEVQSDLFNLKNMSVKLVPVELSLEQANLTVQELESMRTERPGIPASKHGLEILCGASCETGAF
jgi:hypothetical protein